MWYGTRAASRASARLAAEVSGKTAVGGLRAGAALSEVACASAGNCSARNSRTRNCRAGNCGTRNCRPDRRAETACLWYAAGWRQE